MKHTKKIASIILCLAMLLTLSACGTEAEPSETKELITQTNGERSLEDSAMEQPAVLPTAQPTETAPVEEVKTLVDFVTMTDISIEPIEAYSKSIDTGTRQGYMIQATVSNKNDVSVDVFPAFSVVVTDTDNYGDARERNILLLNSGSITTPYGTGARTEDAKFLCPVGLAPHETKNVRYYIIPEGVYSINVADFDAGQKAEIYLSKITSINNIELYDLSVSEASQVYLAAEDWGRDIRMVEIDASVTGLRMIEEYIEGTITNSTTDRWASVTVQFDITVDSQATYDSVRQMTYSTYNYVNIGDIIDFVDSSGTGLKVAAYEKGDYCVEMIPALLAYTPDLDY